MNKLISLILILIICLTACGSVNDKIIIDESNINIINNCFEIITTGQINRYSVTVVYDIYTKDVYYFNWGSGSNSLTAIGYKYDDYVEMMNK